MAREGLRVCPVAEEEEELWRGGTETGRSGEGIQSVARTIIRQGVAQAGRIIARPVTTMSCTGAVLPSDYQEYQPYLPIHSGRQ